MPDILSVESCGELTVCSTHPFDWTERRVRFVAPSQCEAGRSSWCHSSESQRAVSREQNAKLGFDGGSVLESAGALAKSVLRLRPRRSLQGIAASVQTRPPSTALIQVDDVAPLIIGCWWILHRLGVNHEYGENCRDSLQI